MTRGVLDAPPDVTPARRRLRDVLHLLELALLGTEETHPNGALANPRTASAFAPGSTFRPVDLGPGLWAVARTSQDGTDRVLCVHNISDRPLSFTPDQHLDGPRPHTPLLFLRGATFAVEEQGTTVCRIDAHASAWLGRFPETATEASTDTPTGSSIDPSTDPNGDGS